MEIGRSELARLTFGKGAVNTAIRWLPFFLPTLAIAFDSSTATLAALLGLAEAAGLSTMVGGRMLDAGLERLAIILSLIAVAVSSGLALLGSIWALAAALVILGAASGYVTVAGHTWISARVTFDRRARFIGVYEISWASALLIGVPLISILISRFGWRGPFIAVGGAALVAAVGVALIDDGHGGVRQVLRASSKARLTGDVWLVIALASSVAIAGLTTIVIAGTWLDEALGVSTGGIGLVAMGFGLAELMASVGSSAFADRWGKGRSMQFSVLGLLGGLVVISLAGSSLVVGVAGLLIFFVGFEYSIVTSFSVVSEAMPTARGRVLGISNAASTVSRGVGVAAAGILYESFGIGGPVVLSMVTAAGALVLLLLVARRRPDLVWPAIPQP